MKSLLTVLLILGATGAQAQSQTPTGATDKQKLEELEMFTVAGLSTVANAFKFQDIVKLSPSVICYLSGQATDLQLTASILEIDVQKAIGDQVSVSEFRILADKYHQECLSSLAN